MNTLLQLLKDNWVFLLLVVGVLLYFFVFRTKPTAGIDSLQALDSSITAGQPVVLDFYSNF